jgi:hypothetical protein
VPGRGYLDSLLQALGIDPSSQTLVYSKTSLQIDLIRAATPRAIYFDDDTYVAWIRDTNTIEVSTMDSALGPVFYTLRNRDPAAANFDRETLRCLTCHDTFSLMGGGVPRFLFMSSPVTVTGEPLTTQISEETTDATPIQDRWGGWYVTGTKARPMVKAMLDPLVKALLLADATPLPGRITGNSGFDSWFRAQGPSDGHGHSLRELDLKTRVFRYPLSYMIYSAGFDGLPGYAKEYVYRRLADVLGGRDRSAPYAWLSDADRATVLEILTATKPEFAAATRDTPTTSPAG